MDKEGKEGKWIKIKDKRLTRLYICKPILNS
jgi:hypothetical protein